MSIESDHQHQGYHDPYEQQQQQDNSHINQHHHRPIYSHTQSTDSIHSNNSNYHQQEYQAILPQQPQQQSPHRSSMSSQPTTPKPSSATAIADSNASSPTLNKNDEMPLYVTPGTPGTNNQEGTSYSPHTNTIRTTSHRKDSVVPNINETCPSFGLTDYRHNIVSMDRHSIIDVRLHTKVDRGFFLAEEDWTCYRRNYFQVSGSFSLEGIGILYEGQEFPCLAKDEHTGQLHEIHCFMLGVSARLSDCEKSIQLIQHTPKRDKGPQTTPTPKQIRPGGNIGFSAVGSSQSIVTFERLQFKTATANNGKRRAAQQYYVIIVELFAKLRNGNMITVASTKSSALVVRGRSPGHYAETDSNATHTVAPRQHRVSHQPPPTIMPPPPLTAQQQAQPAHYNHGSQPSTPTGYNGRPTAYAGASPNLFQPTEYMPSYDYSQHQQPGYTTYNGHPAPQQYPNNNNTNTNNTTPIMQHHYVPHRNNESYPQHYDHSEVKEENHHQQQSPYYWQRSNEQQQHEEEHWSRIRMASNQSSHSSHHDASGAPSPYMNHPHQQHSYYPPPQQQTQHYYSNGQHQGMSHPPPPPQAHYNNNYEWQRNNGKMANYSYESDSRRQEYGERIPQQQPHSPPVATTPTKATIVK